MRSTSNESSPNSRVPRLQNPPARNSMVLDYAVTSSIRLSQQTNQVPRDVPRELVASAWSFWWVGSKAKSKPRLAVLAPVPVPLQVRGGVCKLPLSSLLGLGPLAVWLSVSPVGRRVVLWALLGALVTSKLPWAGPRTLSLVRFNLHHQMPVYSPGLPCQCLPIRSYLHTTTSRKPIIDTLYFPFPFFFPFILVSTTAFCVDHSSLSSSPHPSSSVIGILDSRSILLSLSTLPGNFTSD